MSTMTYPLAMPEELMAKARDVATSAGVSVADAMRLGLEEGLPVVKQKLGKKPFPFDAKPMTAADAKRCYATPDPEWDAVEAAMCRHPGPEPED